MFLRGVEMGGRGRRVDSDPRGLVVGRKPDRHGVGRVRVGRGREGRSDGGGGEVYARGGRGGVDCGGVAGAEDDGDAVDVVHGRQEGREGGVVRGVPVHGVMRGRLSGRGRAATAAGPPATGAWPGRSAARSPGWRATA